MPSKDIALELVQKMHCTLKYKVYCNGSLLEGGVGATAILYKNNRILKVSRAYLGKDEEHTIYKAELVGVLLALSLLHNLSSQLTTTTLIGLNNQAVIKSLNNQLSHPSHFSPL